MKMLAQEPTMCNGTVARFVIGRLEGFEKGGEAESIQGGERGAPGDGSLALDGAGAGVFIRRTRG